MKKYILLLVILFGATIGFAEKIAQLPGLLKPDFIQVDGDELFVAEETTYSIDVYSLTTFKVKFKLGKKGEGPGEFKLLPRLREVAPDYLLVSGGDKNIWYSRDGKMIKEKILLQARRLTPVKNNYAANSNEFAPGQPPQKVIYLLNSNFERIKTLYKLTADVNWVSADDPPDKEYKMLYHFFGFWCHDDKVFVADSAKGFFIDVFDFNGNHLYSIDKNNQVEKVKVSNAYKKKALEGLKIFDKWVWEHYSKSSFTFYDHFPAIRDFWIDNKKIYVTTYKEQGDNHEIIILDIKGNILARLLLPLKSLRDFKGFGVFDHFTVHNDILYELVDNEDTNIWELHKTNLKGMIK